MTPNINSNRQIANLKYGHIPITNHGLFGSNETKRKNGLEKSDLGASHSQYHLSSQYENAYPYQLGSLVATGKNVHHETSLRLQSHQQKNLKPNFVGQGRFL